MKTYKLRILFVAVCASLAFVSCNDDDDNGNVINNSTCTDGIMNGTETGVDCGGDDCTPCNTTTNLNFDGDFMQEDTMGRPGVNTVFSPTDEAKNAYNVSTVSNRGSFQPGFENQLAAYHSAFGATYEANILGLDLTTFTSVLATTDALQVAPEGTTAYFTPNAQGGVMSALTGRNLADDVIDISLILSFGGNSGAKFNGENGTPELVSDNIGIGNRIIGTTFPYMEKPLQ